MMPVLISSYVIILFLLPFPSSMGVLVRCSSSLKCFDPNAKCVYVTNSFVRFCECDSGFNYDPYSFPYCTKSIPVGHPCNNSFECQRSDPQSVCSSSVPQICECRTGFSLNLLNRKCFPIQYRRLTQSIGQTTRSKPLISTTVSTTPPSSTTPKVIEDDHKKRATIQWLCSNDANCTDPKAKCVYETNSESGICKCENGYRPNPVSNIYCIRPVLIGGNCSISKECRLSDLFSTCSSSNPRVCGCLHDHVYNQDTKRCDMKSSDSVSTFILLIPVAVTFFATMGLCLSVIKSIKSKRNSQRSATRCSLPQTNTPVSSPQSNSLLNCNQTTATPPVARTSDPCTFTDTFEGINRSLDGATFTPITPSAPPMTDDRPPTYEEAVYRTSALINLR